MAVTKIHRTSRYVMYATIAITIIVAALFVFGGQVPAEQRVVADMVQPKSTDLLLFWMYTMLAITVVSIFVFVIIDFFNTLRTRPKSAIRTLVVLISFAVLLIVAYSFGDGTPLNIVGYDGTDNVPSILKMTDMWLYGLYVMMVLTILAILIPIKRITKK